MASQGGLTFVFTDIEGSTRLAQEMETGWGLALRICRRMVVDAFAEHAGREFGNEGDGQFFVFSDPVAGVTAAVAAQRRIGASLWPDDVSLRLRMGIHRGPVRMSGGEYVGTTIHEVARICAAANGGQILCSADVATALHASPDVGFVNLGRYVLRGIAGSRSLFQIVADGVDAELASPREAVREGGRRVTIWRREPPVVAKRGARPSTVGLDPAPLAWTARVPGIEAVIVRIGDGADTTVRVTVLRDGVVEEEYDGLSIGGECDAGAVVNATSRYITMP